MTLTGALTIGILPGSASALTLGFDGINDYSGSIFEPNCTISASPDRAGATYVNNLNTALASHPKSFLYADDYAWESDLHKNGPIDTVNFFAYAGHGAHYSYYAGLNGSNSAHFYSQNGNPNYHGSADEGNDSVNATYDEVKLGSTGTLRFASFYSCNWLTNGGDQARQEQINQTFEGVNLITGFASKMWLDSREGTAYGSKLENGVSVKQAWFEAAQEWQPQYDELPYTINARVVGHKLAETDSFWSYMGSVPTYAADPAGYMIWTLPITATGVAK
jgi:hypothetical protein